MNAKTAQLFGDKEFVTKLYPMSFEEVKSTIEAEGGEVTIDELKEIASEVAAILEKRQASSDELSEEELEGVAGGGFFGSCVGALLGSAAGMALGGPLGAFALSMAGAARGKRL